MPTWNCAASRSKVAPTMVGFSRRAIAIASSRLLRQQPVGRLGRDEAARPRADHLGVGRLADRERDLGIVEVGGGAGDPRLGLRHVGRRHVADAQAGARGVERLPQERRIEALRLDQRLVAQHAHVGGGAVEQHALLDRAQRLAARPHLRLGLAHRARGLEAVEQRLVDRDAGGPRLEQRRLRARIRQQVAHRDQSRAQAHRHLRTIARQRLRHVLVGAAQLGALGIELRIVLIGAHQRLGQALGAGGARGREHREQDQAQNQPLWTTLGITHGHVRPVHGRSGPRSTRSPQPT